MRFNPCCNLFLNLSHSELLNLCNLDGLFTTQFLPVMATIQISKRDDTRYAAKISIDQEEQVQAEKAAISKLSKTKKVSGFRKGKVPEHIIKSKFAAEMAEETLQATLKAQLPNVVRKAENGLYRIVGVENLNVRASAYSYELVFDSNPYIKLGNKLGKIKGISVLENKPIIEDSDIEDEILSIKHNMAEISEKEGDELSKGDLIICDLEIWFNDIPVGEPMKDSQFILGEPGTDREVEKIVLEEKKKVGDDFVVKKEFSAEEIERIEKTEDNGITKEQKEYDLRVSIKEAKSVKYPEVDDEFAKRYKPDLANVAELREHIGKNLETRFHRKDMDAQIGTAIDVILPSAELFLPENYLDHKVADYFKTQGVDPSAMNEEQMKEFSDSVLTYEKRRILVNHFIKEATSLDKKKDAGIEYRDRFSQFLREELNPDMANSLIGVYDQMANEEEVDEISSKVLERYLSIYHQNLIEQYFRKLGIVKKGKKILVKDILQAPENQD